MADPANALVPNAQVTLTQKATGTVRTGTSNETGLFRLLDLPPGEYSLRIQAAGFKAHDIAGIALASNETRDLGTITLQLGAVTEAISVTAPVTPVQTASSERGGLITATQLNDLALKARDAFSFLRLLPGVVDGNRDRAIADTFSMNNISINGQTSKKKNVLFDGIASMDWGGNNSTLIMPNLESVAEIKVLANAFQAEFGRFSGGNINLITKGGTREFHGSGWWNRRHENLNANTFFNNRQNVPKPIYRYTIPGYSIGGPIYVPRLFNTSRQRFFFFASQEFTPMRVPASASTANMPTALERSGDFSKSFDSLGRVITITDAAAGAPFPGNVIPKDRINPIGQAILNLFPLPNGYVNPAPGQQYMANYMATASGSNKRRNEIVRIDILPTDTMNLFLRAGRDTQDSMWPFAVGPGLGGRVNFRPGYVFTGRLTHTLSPTRVNEVSFGLGHDNYGFYNTDPDSNYFRTSSLNPPSLRTTPLQYCGAGDSQSCWNEAKNFLPSFQFAGGSLPNAVQYMPGRDGGNRLPYKNANDSYTLADNLSLVVGSHTFKTGVYVEKEVKIEPSLGYLYAGAYNFGRNVNNPLDSNHGYANALLGTFSTYSEDTKIKNPYVYTWNVEGYVQDSWRASRRLTLDLGVRWRHLGVEKDNTGSLSGFYPQLWDRSKAPRLYWPAIVGGKSVALDKATGATAPAVLVNTIVPGSGSPDNGMHISGLTGNSDFYRYPFLVFAPRLGFAWDVLGDGKTAIRGGAGIFHNMQSSGQLDQQKGLPPVLYSQVIYYSTFSQVPQAAASAALPATSAATAYGDMKVEDSYQANLTIERDIGFNTVVDIAYVGNFVRHAIMGPGGSSGGVDINPIPYQAYGPTHPENFFQGTAVPANLVRTAYPGMGSIIWVSQSLSALNYHGLQVQAQRRLSHGLQFGLAYTWSKALGTLGWDAYHNQRQWFYGPPSGNVQGEDRRHNLVINYTYFLPTPGLRLGPMKYVLNNWVWSGITIFQTGGALTPSCSSVDAGINNSDPSWSGGGARCQAIADWKSFQHDFNNNFNTKAFTLAAPGTFGNIGLGILRQPKWSNWDMTLDKRIRLGKDERRLLRLRLEAYNVFNHTEFSEINASLSLRGGVNTNTRYGQYTATLPARQMSTTLRFEF